MTSLIAYIRDFVHDPGGTRWSDVRILYLIDKAQKDLAIKTLALKAISNLSLTSKAGMFKVPNDFIQLTKVSIDGCFLPIKTHQEVETAACDSCWETAKGTPTAAVIDKQSRTEIRLYPIPPDVEPTAAFNLDMYGLYTDFGGSNYGIIVDEVEDSTYPLSFTEVYGTTTDIGMIPQALEIHYVRSPKTISSTSDELELHETYEQAIKYYVCGNLLRDDRDSNSRELGREELMLYERELAHLSSEAATDFTSGTAYSIQYRRL